MPYMCDGQEKIQYVLSRRAKKYINITLKSNGVVYVSAPKRVPMCEVERVLDGKLEWIRKNIKEKHEEKVYTKEDYNNAKITYSLEVEKWLKVLSKYNIKMPEIKVRKMKTRWGSCIPSKNKITLNIALIYVPKECMEYVVLHELVHFLEPNHGKRFYGIIEEYMSDYKQIRQKLNREYGNIL